MVLGLARGQYVRALIAVYASLFLVRIAFGVSLVTFPLYIVGNDTAFSLVATTSPLLELITVVFAGVLIDKYGRKGVLLTGLGLAAVSLYGLALTQNVFLLGLINALHGIASALILVTTLAVIATYAPPEHRGREMGLFNFANIFGLVAGYVVGFLLSDLFRDQLAYTFVVAGALATMGLLFANRMIKLPEHEGGRGAAAEARPSFKELIRAATSGRVLLLTAPWLIVFMLVGAFLTFLSRVTKSTLQISGASTAIAVLGVGILLVAGQLFWGRLADKHGREQIMLVGAVGFTLLMGVIVYAFFTTPAELTVSPPADFVIAGNETGEARQNGVDAVLRIDQMTPAQGPPGTQVTLTGAGLKGTRAVTFAGAMATFNVVNDTQVVATVPAGAQTGKVVVTAATPAAVVFQNVTSHGALLVMLLFLALAFAPAGLAAIADEAKEGAQGTTMSAYSLTLSLGFIIGPPVLGFISDTWHGTGTVLYFAALAALLFLLVLTRFVQMRRTRSPAHA